MVALTDEKLTEGNSLLATASEQDKRGIYPAIHRDIAYAMASQSEDYAAATEHLRKYVDGHIAVHGGLPLDIDDESSGHLETQAFLVSGMRDMGMVASASGRYPLIGYIHADR